MKTTKHRPVTLSIVGRGSVLFATVLALVPSPVQARNPKMADYWDISGDWEMGQSNHTTMSLHITQEYKNSTAFHGRASYSASDGQIEGTLNGTQLSMQIYWKNGDLALYTGKIDSRGMITGTAYVKGHERNKITWFSSRPMTWSPWPGDITIVGSGTVPIGATPTPIPPPIQHTPGTRNTDLDPNNPIQKLMLDKMAAQRAQAAAKGAPTILASPRTVSIPAGKSEGTATLTWDGGPDHPYAEIWVKVDGQDEKKVVEQGKGERQVTVRPGKTYVYILTDSGQTLSTVTVKIL